MAVGTAAEIARRGDTVDHSSAREPTAFNVNVPGVAIDDVRGLRCAELDRFGYFRVAIADEGGQKLEFELASERRPRSSHGIATRGSSATATPRSPRSASSSVRPAASR